MPSIFPAVPGAAPSRTSARPFASTAPPTVPAKLMKVAGAHERTGHVPSVNRRTPYGRREPEEVARFDEFVDYVRAHHDSDVLDCVGGRRCSDIMTNRFAWYVLKELMIAEGSAGARLVYDYVLSTEDRIRARSFDEDALQSSLEIEAECRRFLQRTGDRRLNLFKAIDILSTFGRIAVSDRYGIVVGEGTA